MNKIQHIFLFVILVGVFGGVLFLFQREDQSEIINSLRTEFQSDPAILRAEIRKFSGLPREERNDSFSVDLERVLVSQDKTKALVVFTTFDQTAEPGGFDGSLPALKAEEFLCHMASQKCTPTAAFALAYKAAVNSEKWFQYSLLWWYHWDSNQNLLYGHLTGEGVGNASPVYIFNLNTKRLQQTIGYDSLEKTEKRAKVPGGAFSPSLAKFVMIDQMPEGNLRDKWDLLVYNSNDLSRPAQVFDISAMRTTSYGASRVGAVAWSSDENNLVLLTDRQLFTLNLKNGAIVLKYTDESQDDSGLWLDSNMVHLSSDGKYALFLDYEERIPGTGRFNTVLKAINLKNGNVLDLS